MNHEGPRHAGTVALLTIDGTLPSLNQLTAGKRRGMIAAKTAVKAATQAAWVEAGQPVFTVPVRITFRVYAPDARRRDDDGIIGGWGKHAVDLLVAKGCLVDDDYRWVERRAVVYVDPERPRCEIEIRARERTADDES